MNVNRNHSSHFEKAKAAFEEGAGNDEMEEEEVPGATVGASEPKRVADDSNPASVNEKGSIEHESNV